MQMKTTCPKDVIENYVPLRCQRKLCTPKNKMSKKTMYP